MKEEVVSSPVEMAKAFNNYFTSFGKNHADEIPLSQHEPEVYLNSTDKRFSLKAPTADCQECLQTIQRLVMQLTQLMSS